MSTTKNTKNVTTIPANPKLTRGQRGELIRNWLPKVKQAFPEVKYIRLEEDGGDLYWIFTSTPDNKKVAEMLRMGEQEISVHTGAIIQTFPEHRLGKAVTALMIANLRNLELPEGANPPRFDNDKREWSLRAKTPEALGQLIVRFEELETHCTNIYDPPVHHTLGIRELGTEKRNRRFIALVINRLREIQLPPGAARIRFDNETGHWQLASQTENDMDLLIQRFEELERNIYEEFTYPINPPSGPIQPEEKVSAPAPDFNGADFPVLPTTPSTV